MTGDEAAILLSIALYSTGHWIGATIALLLTIISIIFGEHLNG